MTSEHLKTLPHLVALHVLRHDGAKAAPFGNDDPDEAVRAEVGLHEDRMLVVRSGETPASPNHQFNQAHSSSCQVHIVMPSADYSREEKSKFLLWIDRHLHVGVPVRSGEHVGGDLRDDLRARGVLVHPAQLDAVVGELADIKSVNLSIDLYEPATLSTCAREAVPASRVLATGSSARALGGCHDHRALQHRVIEFVESLERCHDHRALQRRVIKFVEPLKRVMIIVLVNNESSSP